MQPGSLIAHLDQLIEDQRNPFWYSKLRATALLILMYLSSNDESA
jgi:hypothetical protein